MSDLQESMSSLIECSICLETFEDPRMLTCLHTFCIKCLMDHIDSSAEGGQFQCPVCRESLQVPKDGADAFPRNFFVNSYMAAVRDAGGARAKTKKATEKNLDIECSNLVRGNGCSEAKKFCKDCCEYYCNFCATAHSRFKASRNHELVQLSDVTEGVLMEARLKTQVPQCQKHKKDLELYCSTCKSAVCSVCCLVNHQSHTFEEIEDVDKELQSVLSEVKAKLGELKTTSNNHHQTITRSQKMRESNVSEARATMIDLFHKMRKSLDEKATEVDKKLSEIADDGKKQASLKQKNLTLHFQQLDSLQSFADSLLTKGNVFNRLANSFEVQKRLEQFQSSSLALTAGSTDSPVPESGRLISDVLGTGVELNEDVHVGTATGGQRIHATQTISVSLYKKQKFKVGPAKPKSPGAMTIPVEIIQRELDKMLVKGRASNQEIFDWIDKNVDEKLTAEATFIRALMTSVCSRAIFEAGDKYKVDSEVINDRRPLLEKYLDYKAQHELQALYALQALMHRLEHPPDVFRTFFDTLYDQDLISEDVFNQWDQSDDAEPGKGMARSSVVQFFNWLREAEEESQDES